MAPLKPQLPELPETLGGLCYDAGVASDAYRALSDNRVAWAACRRKHAATVAFYKDVREGMK